MPSLILTGVSVLAAVFMLFAISAREIVFNTVLFVIIGYVIVLVHRHYTGHSEFRFGSDNRQALIELSILIIASIGSILYFMNKVAL